MSNLNRWKKDFKEKKTYTDRIKKMASYIKEDSSVLDIGCGQKELKNFLLGEYTYKGIDLIKIFSADREVIKCDLNMKKPNLSQKYDYAFCSGILEYIDDPNSFIKYLSENCDNLILSYSCKEDYDENLTDRYAWVNRLSKEELEKILTKNGFEIINEDTCYGRQKIFVCKK